MKNISIFFLGLGSSALLVVGALGGGCSSNSTGSGGAGGSGGATTTSSSSSSSSSTSSASSSSSGGGFPAAPTLGAQIDRMGRPAINTALDHTFDTDAMAKGMAKDAYNAESSPAKWSTFVPEVAANLAILDSLDTVCGNQILAGPMAVKGRYDALAGALADDRLWIKTDAAMCTTYLAVEADATMIMKNSDCGGRKLDYDVIDESYSALAAGMLSGVGDGVGADADTKGTTFPYLAAPH